MKKFIILVSTAVMAFNMNAQTVTVVKSSQRLLGKNAEGHAVELEGTAQDVTLALNKFLKTVGKTKIDNSWVVVTDATINGNHFASPVYATVIGKEKTAVAWIGIHAADWSDAGADSINTELEKLVYDFGIVYYRDKIQAQIDLSNQALQAVEHQQTKLITQNRDLNIKLDNNNREQEQLQKATESNKLEHAVILTHLDENKKAQDSLAIAAEKIKEVISQQQEKQNNVR